MAISAAIAARLVAKYPHISAADITNAVAGPVVTSVAKELDTVLVNGVRSKAGTGATLSTHRKYYVWDGALRRTLVLDEP